MAFKFLALLCVEGLIKSGTTTTNIAWGGCNHSSKLVRKITLIPFLGLRLAEFLPVVMVP